jgi:dTDP-4-amino-4,6-dideoxygalactose transaminase
MDVPFVDLKAQYRAIEPEITAAIAQVLEATSFIMGPQLERFEEAFASYTGSRCCIGVGSGTAALELALRAFDVGAGDEVIVPANTYIATAIAVSATGAVPVLVDVGDDYLIDLAAIESAIGARTKAVVPVHLYGQMVEMEPILQLARRHGLLVIEDACQAHGATWQGRRAGSFGHAGAFSFYPGKNLGAYGDGGAIVTDDPAIDERLRLLRDFGQKKKYQHLVKGGNSRLDSIQAAVLSVKLRYLDAWNERRREHAALYDELLAAAGLSTPVRRTRESSVHHLYVTSVPDRARVLEELERRGVHAGIHYPVPIHLQPAYAELERGRGSFAVTEAACERVLSLPMYPELTGGQIEYVVQALTDICRAERATSYA